MGNILRLIRYRSRWNPDELNQRVEALIDGRDLLEYLQEAEVFGRAGGMPYLTVSPPSRHWLGEPDEYYRDDDGRAVVGYGCGEWRCCGTVAAIELGEHEVTWRIEGLPPFRFDRQQYEREIAGLSDQEPITYEARP